MVRRTRVNDRFLVGWSLLSILFFLVSMILLILAVWWSLDGWVRLLDLCRIWLVGPGG
jgi:hypothetical protein